MYIRIRCIALAPNSTINATTININNSNNIDGNNNNLNLDFQLHITEETAKKQSTQIKIYDANCYGITEWQL